MRTVIFSSFILVLSHIGLTRAIALACKPLANSPSKADPISITPDTWQDQFPVYPPALPVSATASIEPATPTKMATLAKRATPTHTTGPAVSVPTTLTGYAIGTTGGGSATPQIVADCATFIAAVANVAPAVIKLTSTLSGCGVVLVGSNKSILGVGSTAGFVGGGLRIRDATNVIIRNISLKQAPDGYDLISLDNAQYVWVDHCDLSNVGLTGDKDKYDGLFDATHASDFITVSWTNFHDHWKGSLIGHSDSNSAEDLGHLRITWAFNQWNNINARVPYLRFGTGHVYNSVFKNIPVSGITSRSGAKILVENSVFANVKNAIFTDSTGGYATSRQNYFLNSNTVILLPGHVTPPYAYPIVWTENVVNTVTKGVGVGKIVV